jgi:hypothetical protein
MHTLVTFALGAIAYALAELAAIAAVSRWFPSKIYRLQRIGDRLYRAFRKSDTPDDIDDTPDDEDPDTVEVEVEVTEEYSSDDTYYPGQRVAYKDHAGTGYGALEGTVACPPIGNVYDIFGRGDGLKHTIMADSVAPFPDGGVIPEGEPVEFEHPCTGVRLDGITYRAQVFDKKLWYIVEYGVDEDVKQECVEAAHVTKKRA